MGFFSAFLSALFGGIANWLLGRSRDKQAREDAQTAATSEQALKGQVEAQVRKQNVDAKMKEALNDPSPDMHDWN
jgi:membrane protein YqaA with SNARE-associated domain